MWLNLYGHQGVRCKLKKGVKTQKMHFYPFFELISNSLTTIKVEPHQCPLHQSILLTQGPIHEIFEKNIENWRNWKTQFFWVGHFEFFFWIIIFFFASSPWKLVANYVLEWMGLNFYFYDGLQPKMRARIINEHECTSLTRHLLPCLEQKSSLVTTP